MEQSVRPQLKVSRVTPRLQKMREMRGQVHYAQFERGLRAVYQRDPEHYKAIPKAFWVMQLGLWNKGYRGNEIHDNTIRAIEHLLNFPMGH